MPAAGPAQRRVLTIPNAFSAARLACIPVFVVVLVQPGHRGWFAAAVLLGGLGATDWVDGFLARRLGQVSTVGKVLDPLADRLLLVTAGISTVAVGAVPVAVAVLALSREAVVAAGFLVVAVAGGRRMEVRMVGKAGAFGLMCALPLFVAGHSSVGWHAAAEALAWVCAGPGLVLAWWSMFVYAPAARRAIADGRLEHGRAA